MNITRINEGEYAIIIDGQTVGQVRRFRQSTPVMVAGTRDNSGSTERTVWAAYHGSRRIANYRTRTLAIEAIAKAVAR